MDPFTAAAERLELEREISNLRRENRSMRALLVERKDLDPPSSPQTGGLPLSKPENILAHAVGQYERRRKRPLNLIETLAFLLCLEAHQLHWEDAGYDLCRLTPAERRKLHGQVVRMWRRDMAQDLKRRRKRKLDRKLPS